MQILPTFRTPQPTRQRTTSLREISTVYPYEINSIRDSFCLIGQSALKTPKQIYFKAKKRQGSRRGKHSNNYSLSTNDISDCKQEKIELLRLGNWLKLSTCTIKKRRSIYLRAVKLLKLASFSKQINYCLAAAALTIIVKFQENFAFDCYRQLPAKNQISIPANYPILKLEQIYKSEKDVLSASNFQLPIFDDFLQILLLVCEKWTRYIRSNSKNMHFPLRYLETGMQSEWERRNMLSVSLLVEVIHLCPEITEIISAHRTIKRNLKQETQMIMIAIYIMCSTNTCTLEFKIHSGNLLHTYICRFMKKCFQMSDQDIKGWEKMLERAMILKIGHKLNKIPLNQDIGMMANRSGLSKADKIRLLEELEYICIDDIEA